MTYGNVTALSNRDLDAEILRREGPRTFRRTNTNEIMAQEFDPIKWVVPGYISEGFLVPRWSARSSARLGWRSTEALAVAGRSAGVSHGLDNLRARRRSLYRHGERTATHSGQDRNTLYPDERNRPDLSRLEWVTEAPQLDAGFIAELERWRVSVPAPRLIVIDVLQRIKPPGSMARNAYENDYSTWAPLQHRATEHGIAVLGLHHTKKGGADDPLEALSRLNVFRLRRHYAGSRQRPERQDALCPRS